MIVKFRYSRPYEFAFAKAQNKDLKKVDVWKRGYLGAMLKDAQSLWDKHEKKIFKLFGQMYKIKIHEKFIIIYLSKLAPISYSDPLTISLKRHDNLKENKAGRIFMLTVIHELAHYFAYSRPKTSYFDTLQGRVKKYYPQNDWGTNLHFLIQAVEFGIGAEVFGEKVAAARRNFVIENWEGEYKQSAELLVKEGIPLNKEALKAIETVCS